MATPVEQIKDRLTIFDVVSSYVKLIPAGKSYKGKSPFTNEKTPSFFVSPDKGLYHCFSTGKGGDMFTFVQEMEGVDFRGALKILADRAGVELTRVDPKVSEERDRLLEAMEEACAFFEKSLEANAEAEQYLLDRGLEEKTIKEFRIGFVPAGWHNLYEVLSKKFSEKDIVIAGLGKKTEKGIYDTFRDRIMFPICDTAGRVIAFSGRILHPDEKSAKYVNSPDTPLFKKSEVLFALDKAKHHIRKYDFTILAEGQFDVVMLHQAGFRNAVGVSGTALSDTTEGANGVNNLGLVKRLADKIVLCFDGDEAGVRAARRSADIALGLGMDVKVISIPPESGKDPADIIRAGGKDAFSVLLRSATHFIEFMAGKAAGDAKDERTLGIAVTRDILPSVAALLTETEKAFFIKRIADITGLPEAPLWRDLERIRPAFTQTPISNSSHEPRSTRRDDIERRLFALYFGSSDDPVIKSELVTTMGEEKFAELDAKFAPLRHELSFELLTFGEEGVPYDARREMLVNLEEDYISEKIEGLRKLMSAAERAGRDAEAETHALDYQKLSERLAAIKNGRHLHKF